MPYFLAGAEPPPATQHSAGAALARHTTQNRWHERSELYAVKETFFLKSGLKPLSPIITS